MTDWTSALADRVWYGDDRIASAARTILSPAERLFGGVVGARDILYDAGWLPSYETPIPAVSVGNLTVGGTGKTPIAAWIARGLLARDAHPAIVLRGYGGDETLVHKRLNPSIPIVANADRVAGVFEAEQQGADVAVLDDAFQHRRVQRLADLVLISADRWTNDVCLLPAGPWREPLKSIRRATLVIVTRKSADDQTVDIVHETLSHVAPAIPRVSVRLELGELVDATGVRDAIPLEALAGASVHAVLSIADPRAFVHQLEHRGARVRASIFPDHHAFSRREIEQIAAEIRDAEWVVCTLKDAVKLAPHWPRLAPPLLYVSQHVMVERGVGGIERVLDDLVRARSKTPSTAG
jgi:tetraacyldisaccharide 4'-kinase